MTSPPPMSYTPWALSVVTAARIAATASTTAIGSTRWSIQSGNTVTGRRWASWVISSKLVEAAPSTTAARRPTKRHRAAESSSSTSRREARCSESSSRGMSGMMPER